MDTLIIAIIVIVVLLAGGYWLLSRKRGLPEAVIVQTWRHWEALKTIGDSSRRVVEAEKILDDILYRRGYKGSFADKMRSGGKALPNEQAVWDAHKMRNRIAHEVGYAPSEKEADRAVAAFEKALRSLL